MLILWLVFAPKTIGTTRRTIARSKKDLHHTSCLPLENGWWLGTSLSTDAIVRIIRRACEVARVNFDTQLHFEN